MDTVVIDMSTAIAIMGYCALLFFILFSIKPGDAPRKGTNLPCWITSEGVRTRKSLRDCARLQAWGLGQRNRQTHERSQKWLHIRTCKGARVGTRARKGGLRTSFVRCSGYIYLAFAEKSSVVVLRLGRLCTFQKTLSLNFAWSQLFLCGIQLIAAT